MKQMRLWAFLIFAACAFCLPATAQTNDGSDPSGRYEYHKGIDRLVLIITKRPSGYAVSGETNAYGGGGSTCKIRGTYYPATQRVKARCVDGTAESFNIDGLRQEGRDAIQLDLGGVTVVVARRVSEGSLTGSWSIVQTAANGARYSGKLEIKQSGSRLSGRAVWDNHMNGEVNGTMQGQTVRFTITYGGGLVGTYSAELNEDTMEGSASSNKGGGAVRWQATRQ